MGRNQQQQHEDDIPPPPPPPMDEKSLDVMYGDANTYSNNHIADDQSVEAQHVVYSFSEEGEKKSSKTASKSRKRWICLMLTVVTLVAIIIALGVVYGKQMQDRKKANLGTTLSEANESQVSTAVEDTTIGVDGGMDVVDTTTVSTEDVDANTTPADTEGDVYITPDAADELVAGGDEDYDEDKENENENEEEAPWGPVTGIAEVVTPTNSSVATQPDQDQDQGTPPPTDVASTPWVRPNQGDGNEPWWQNTVPPSDVASTPWVRPSQGSGNGPWWQNTVPPSDVASTPWVRPNQGDGNGPWWQNTETPTDFPVNPNGFGEGNVFLPSQSTPVPTEAVSGIEEGEPVVVAAADVVVVEEEEPVADAAVVVVEEEEEPVAAAAVVVVEEEEEPVAAAAVVVVEEEDELPSAEVVEEVPAGDDKEDKN